MWHVVTGSNTSADARILRYLFKKRFPCEWTTLCVCWCLQGHWEEGGGSNMRWLWWRSWDLGKKRNAHKKIKNSWISPFLKAIPLHANQFVHLLMSLGALRRGGQIWDGRGGDVDILEKRNTHKSEELAYFPCLKKRSFCICWCLLGHWERGSASNARWRLRRIGELEKMQWL